MRSAIAAASAAEATTPLEPGVVGTPASSASFLAVALSPHRAYRSAGRPHENEALRFDEIGEIGVLREKSITRMNRVHAQRRRRREYPPCVQVTLLRLGTANAHRTVRHANGERIPVGLGRPEPFQCPTRDMRAECERRFRHGSQPAAA